MARNLIIGAIEGYRFEQIAPFFLSLRKVNYTGQTVIFHRDIDAACRERLWELGVSLVELPAKGLQNPFTGRMHSGQGRFGDVLAIGLRALRMSDAGTLAFAKRFFHIANLRFLTAAVYLRQHAGQL